MFDTARYDREVLRPLRGTHGQLPPGDLLARYSIDPDMDAAELTDHLREIRAFWARRAQAPDFRGEVCKLLIHTDQALRRTAGAAMDDPAWWREQAQLYPATRTYLADDPLDRSVDVAATSTDLHDWRAQARRQFWAALATVDRHLPLVVAAPVAPPRPAPAAPAPLSKSSLTLRVRPTVAENDLCRVELSWPAEVTAKVLVRSSTDPSPFVEGEEISPAQAQQWGAELTGTPVQRDGRLVLTATVPTGYRLYLPFEVSGAHLRVGRPAGLGIAVPLQRLRIERDGAGARVSWVWPSDSTLFAEVAWGGLDAEPAEHAEVTRERYTTGNGFAIPDVRSGVRVSIRAVADVGGSRAYSPATVAGLEPAPASIAYDLRRRWRLGGPSELLVTLRSDRDCNAVQVYVVVSAGEFLPLDRTAGRLHARLGPLRLSGDVPLVVACPWPDVPKQERPSWIRCFVQAPSTVSAVDPPIDRMRII